MGKCTPLCRQCDWKGDVNDPLARCVAHAPALNVDPPYHVFPTTAVDAESDYQTFTITNTGQGGDLVIGQITLIGAEYNQFRIVRDRASGETIHQGRSKTIRVRFSPNSRGSKAAEINIPSNVADSPTRVPIRGTTYKVIVVISVDWDGHDLRDANINAFENFRNNAHDQDNGQPIPFTHFICASYFTGPNIAGAVNPNPSTVPNISTKIQRALRAQDEIGLHVHGWQTVIVGSGVGFTNNHHWADPTITVVARQTPGYHNCWRDIGHTNPLTDYNANEVCDILTHSRTVLNNNLGGGYRISNSFRSGGWVTNAAVRQGIYDAGFRIDSSAVANNPAFNSPHDFSNWHGDWRAGPIGPINQQKQPFLIDDGAGRILKEVPDNCYLADYINTADMDDHMQNWALTQPGPVLVAIGFHQETVSELYTYDNAGVVQDGPGAGFLPRIENVLNQWHGDGTWQHLQFCTVEEAADIFLP